MEKKYFNIAGPCVPGKHYMLDPLRGIEGELMELINSGQYFVIHAARQSGKTTLLLELADRLNASGAYYALYCSLEAIQGINDPEKAMPEIVKKIAFRINQQGLPGGFEKDADYGNFSNVLSFAFGQYCRSLDKPLAVFFDEADCLSNGTLILFLRQLREGYISRGREPFVHSVALVGMRNIRDYKASIRPDSATLGSASPFNIVGKSLSLRNFTRDELTELYAQHSAETGQVFETKAAGYAFEQTQGQPWLVNAIACECTEEITKKNYAAPVTREMAEEAVQRIILDRGTHVDSLLERLKENRVRNIVEPLILGEEVVDTGSDDYLYTRDLGLIRELGSTAVPANPIYAELMIRALTWNTQRLIGNECKEQEAPHYIKGGRLDMDILLGDFQQYWRENSEIWKERYRKHYYEYEEAAPHLVLQAFLQRVMNGGGRIIREMALGSRRADLCVVFEGRSYPIELKLFRGEKSINEGITQLSAYMDKMGTDAGWLVLFDRDAAKPWDEKIYLRKETLNGKTITVAGC